MKPKHPKIAHNQKLPRDSVSGGNNPGILMLGMADYAQYF